MAFAAYRVTGSWRGERSGLQILPPPPGAPTVPYEMGEHPFLLEFPLHSDAEWKVTNARRRREVRKLTLLLSILVRGGVRFEQRQLRKAWAVLPREPAATTFQCAYLQLSYFADFGQVVSDSLSPPAAEAMQVLAPGTYYERYGLDGTAFDVPADLDESICQYRSLAPEQRERFDRALYWLDIAMQQWSLSMSASFASLVSAVEALTVRGVTHTAHCEQCGRDRAHDEPGPTGLFKDFFEEYAPGTSRRKDRDLMYQLRSKISHGAGLMAFDEGRAFGWDPPFHRQGELHDQLWALTLTAVRNYLGKRSRDV